MKKRKSDQRIINDVYHEMMCTVGFTVSGQLIGELFDYLINRFGNDVSVDGTIRALDDLIEYANIAKKELQNERSIQDVSEMQ